MKKSHIIVLFFILVCFLTLRFVHLDADLPLHVFAHVNDEAFKTQPARYMALWETWVDDDSNSGLLLAPLYSLFVVASYKLLDVSLFSTRILSAIAGVLSIILLYVILSKENKKIAFFSSFLLSIHHLFFILNRIGLPESLLILFSLAGFWLIYDSKKYWRFVFAGIIFGASFLLKISQLYFMPAVFLFLLISYLQKKIKIMHAVSLLFSYGLVLGGYFLFIQSIKGLLEATLIHGSSVNLMYLFVARAFVIFVTSIFSFPSMYLLAIICLLYFYFVSSSKNFSFSFFGIKKYLISLNGIEKLAISWLFGTMIGILFTSLVYRRFAFVIIPLVIFPSILLFGKKSEFENNHKVSISPASEKFDVPSFLSLFFGYFLTISLLANYVILTKSVFDGFHDIFSFSEAPSYFDLILSLLSNGYFLLILFLCSVITLLFLLIFLGTHKHWFSNRKILMIGQILKQGSFFAILSLLTLGFFRLVNFQFFSAVASEFAVHLVAFIFSIVLFMAIFYHVDKSLKALIWTYVSYCIVVILLFSVLFASFTIKDASLKVDSLTEDGDFIIGYFAHGFSIESHTKPIRFKFEEPFRNYVDYDVIEEHRPVLYFKQSEHEPFMNDISIPEISEIPYELELIDTVELNNVFGIGRPWNIIEIYKINYALELNN